MLYKTCGEVAKRNVHIKPTLKLSPFLIDTYRKGTDVKF